ncbi:5474_t:CDS:2 [Paraglomus occultum]|uniref:5474_t:CDS:1 n=1 Tax=Paraglomus occultum TaxID=144539 RepID=A0A9N8WPE3_9GLOM|nr:5474_t:CDS:2 [Paraglomus occultum]
MAKMRSKRVPKAPTQPRAKRVKAASTFSPLPGPETYPTKKKIAFVMGNGDCAQLGLGEDCLKRKKPMPIRSLEDKNIVYIATACLHNVAITEDGKVYSWGCNDHGALGRTTNESDEYVPGLVEGLDGVKIIKAVCGGNITLVLSEEGRVYAAGTFKTEEGSFLGFSPELARQQQKKFVPLKYLERTRIVDIGAGSNHALALSQDGLVYSWGLGDHSQLGRRISTRRPDSWIYADKVAGLSGIKKIACAAYHNFAIDGDKNVYTWGLNNMFQCGLNVEGDIQYPTIIEFFEDKNVEQIAAGEHHSVFLLENGDVYTVGRGDAGQLGIGSLPVNSDIEPETKEVEAKVQDHKDGEKANGTSKSTKTAVSIPRRVSGLPPCKSIASGDFHTLALSRDGKVYTWGSGITYALGNGRSISEDDDTGADELVPYELTGQKIIGVEIVSIGGGSQHSLLLGIQDRTETNS